MPSTYDPKDIYMRTHTIPAVALLLTALTACSGTTEPKSTPTVTVTATPTHDKAAVIKQCTDAVAEIPGGEGGEVPLEPTPGPCSPLTEAEYLDAYMEGISQGNKAATDALKDKIEKAASTGGQ
ncbi:hypothetical protein [Streptomyces sp. NPDC058657]|uniref:hypothetical protein n=1 Tax=unclassified Streptomyces TaxID=2593676 RepID=UPI00364F7517